MMRRFILLPLVFSVSVFACGGDTGGNNGPDGVTLNDFSWFDNGTADGRRINPDFQLGDGTLTDATIAQDSANAHAIESQEMVLKIVTPASHKHSTVTSTNGFLSGLVTGVPDSITWQTQTGATGTATGIPFWTTDLIPLNPGDNLITVTAVRGDEVQQDSITLTVNQGFKFGSRLRARPDVIFVGQSLAVVFSINADLYKNFVPGSLELIEVDAIGNPLGSPVTMADNGQTTSNGDEIAQDAIFTARLTLQGTAPGARKFRVRAQVQFGPGVSLAYSEVLDIDVVTPIGVDECQQIVSLQTSAKNAYQGAVGASGQSAAVQSALQTIMSSPQVAEADITTSGHSVWVRYKNGLLGSIPLNPAGYRGGSTPLPASDVGQVSGGVNSVAIGSRQALLLSPYNNEFANLDENTGIQDVFSQVQCPYFDVSGPHKDSAANMIRFQDMYKYGLVSVTSHGDTAFDTLSPEAKDAYGWFHKGAQEVIWTGEPINCSSFTKEIGASCTADGECGAGSRCVIQSLVSGTPQGICVDYVQSDLRRGRVIFGTDRFGILPTFIQYHARTPYPESVVYLGACRSTWNGSMAAALFGSGARTIVGYSDYITSSFASQRGVEFFDRLIRPDSTTGKGLLSGQAHLELTDPDNQGAYFRLIGARNLDASQSEILNPSFETGDQSGWIREGDGRVIGQLGESAPVSGKFMGIISTGLGYTTQTGELAQTFCIPAGRTKLTVWWRFYSEEFLTFCGSIYQDKFKVSLESDLGQLDPVDVSVDDLCPTSECFGCGGLHPLTPSDVDFDIGDAYKMQTWVRTEQSLVGTGIPGGGPVTLRLFATDTGDSIYDSAVLIDDVRIE